MEGSDPVPDLNSTILSDARRAVQQATRLYLSNPRVSLIDFGLRIRDQQQSRLTDEPCLRIHVRNKPRGEQLEILAAESPSLYLPDEELRALVQSYPFEVDLPLGDYRTHEAVGARPTLAGAVGRVPVRHDRMVDPMLGGVSVGNAWLAGAGTLGGKVVDRRGDQMLLSNWHVLAGRWWIGNGAPISQPGCLDGGGTDSVVAYLAQDAWRSHLDAAVARLAVGSRQLVNDQLEIGAVTGAARPVARMRVTKSGRTTGVTWGIVSSILPGRMITYADGFPRVVRDIWAIEPELVRDRVSGPGDSGSMWLDANTWRAVGLHFAGESDPPRALAMGMPAVLDALAVDIALR
jgi:hypothetical protein